jgi:hypothetical protein
LWTLEPTGKTDTDQLAGSFGIDAWCDLRGDGRQAKAVYAELPLKAGLNDGLRVS